MKDEEILNLIKYRLDQAQIALNDAKFLLEGKRSPQSIINRSYYAMFYAALALLQRIDKVPSKHAGVISLFDTEFVSRGLFPKDFSKDFHKAFEFRQNFDYKIMKPISLERAEESLNKANRFVKAVKEYLNATMTATKNKRQ